MYYRVEGVASPKLKGRPRARKSLGTLVATKPEAQTQKTCQDSES